MTITVLNLILTTVILILSLWAFIKRKSEVAQYQIKSNEAATPVKAIAIPSVSLFIGLAFGLFAVSHALTLAGLAKSLEALLIVIRTIGYLLVMVAPIRILLKK